MPRDPNRERIRARQACQNCRKKKARCPSERPACSSCVRLGRRCVYDEPASSERLAELEQKVDLLLSASLQNQVSNVVDESPPREPPRASPHRNPDIPVSPPPQQLPEFDASSSTIQESAISQGIDIYFKWFHRQPIWCFDCQDLSSYSQIPTQLAHSILQVAARFSRTNEQLPAYGENARWLIMLQMAKGTVETESIESLCLLSYSSFIDGNMHLGQFYLGLGLQLCRSQKLDNPSVLDSEGPTTEREKRVLWSLQLLEWLYGDQCGILRAPINVLRPFFVTHDRDMAFPKDPAGGSAISGIGLWNLSLHFAWTWGRVRQHVSEMSRKPSLEEPWRLDSTYASVLADLTEIENKSPLCHRYNIVKFHERPVDEVHRDRDYWIPWLKLQLTWHSVLVMLNHPFLYLTACEYDSNLATPNTFWRRSSELVLLHATWIVRTIDLATEKKLNLVDPFLGHAAAIAATVHLYFCAAADLGLRQKSKAHFTKCKQFLESFSPVSPACQRLAELLEKLTKVALASQDWDSEQSLSKIQLSIPLMWAILQFDISTSPSDSSTSSISIGITEPEQTAIIEIGTTGTPPAIKTDLSQGHDASLPPYKTSSTNGGIGSIGNPGRFAFNTPWLWSDPFGYGGAEDLLYFTGVPTGGDNSDGPSTSWNFGNL
ncbi:hypothetical protein ASPVEDRAFT_65211 [Aspergillus versicolor CBS 583.65]|uniref:Zn(2)-C6 fungal-type domain-containing protein n=1 Tax=Aspergillus versicolor CBS 583.65 TaxID=1036611 RepID=A0A1L9PYL5_ASPVE|nr:uncharacterized protein ASPVEDRAFT_65211 [Aspergillus versicolor CBS 583.65]OJJ06532.1 hypothetical protein ASPVEDRAFT_65211 [Aspergillus versicolor CBS 583.65]